MKLSKNLYYEARWQYEVLSQRKEGLDTLMSHFVANFGVPAFHSYDAGIFDTTGHNVSFFEKFETAVSYMMFRKVPFGSSDYLSLELVYGQVFAELWRICPEQYWFYQLLTKDFRVPSLSQLWIEPVSEEFYGETDSLPFIQELFLSEASNGWIGLSGQPYAFGKILLDVDSIKQINRDAWCGLKEWFLDEFPSACNPKSEKELWTEKLENSPQATLERAINLIWNGSNDWRDLLKMINQGPQFEHFKSILIAAIKVVFEDEDADQYFLKVARACKLGTNVSFLRQMSDTLHGKKEISTLEVFFSNNS